MEAFHFFFFRIADSSPFMQIKRAWSLEFRLVAPKPAIGSEYHHGSLRRHTKHIPRNHNSGFFLLLGYMVAHLRKESSQNPLLTLRNVFSKEKTKLNGTKIPCFRLVLDCSATAQCETLLHYFVRSS